MAGSLQTVHAPRPSSPSRLSWSAAFADAHSATIPVAELVASQRIAAPYGIPGLILMAIAAQAGAFIAGPAPS